MGNVTNLSAARKAAQTQQAVRPNGQGPVSHGSPQGAGVRQTEAMRAGHAAAGQVAQRPAIGAVPNGTRASAVAVVERAVRLANNEQMAATNPAGGPT